MFALILVAAAMAPLSAHHVNPAPAEAIAGRWVTETRHGIIEITPCANSICGRLIDSDSIRADPHHRDERNKDAAQRNRPLKGIVMLQGFSGGGPKWDGGTVYNPDDGGTYKGTITVVDPNTLKVRGCIVWPLCKSQTWNRVR